MFKWAIDLYFYSSTKEIGQKYEDELGRPINSLKAKNLYFSKLGGYKIPGKTWPDVNGVDRDFFVSFIMYEWYMLHRISTTWYCRGSKLGCNTSSTKLLAANEFQISMSKSKCKVVQDSSADIKDIYNSRYLLFDPFTSVIRSPWTKPLQTVYLAFNYHIRNRYNNCLIQFRYL